MSEQTDIAPEQQEVETREPSVIDRIAAAEEEEQQRTTAREVIETAVEEVDSDNEIFNTATHALDGLREAGKGERRTDFLGAKIPLGRVDLGRWNSALAGKEYPVMVSQAPAAKLDESNPDFPKHVDIHPSARPISITGFIKTPDRVRDLEELKNYRFPMFDIVPPTSDSQGRATYVSYDEHGKSRTVEPDSPAAKMIGDFVGLAEEAEQQILQSPNAAEVLPKLVSTNPDFDSYPRLSTYT
jgi:hypothetical protein